jgi:hypothetical protein
MQHDIELAVKASTQESMKLMRRNFELLVDRDKNSQSIWVAMMPSLIEECRNCSSASACCLKSPLYYENISRTL